MPLVRLRSFEVDKTEAKPKNQEVIDNAVVRGGEWVWVPTYHDFPLLSLGFPSCRF